MENPQLPEVKLNMFSSDSVDLKKFVNESTEAMTVAFRQGVALHIPVGERWSIGTHPEVGPYKIDYVALHVDMVDITSPEQFICKSLSSPFMPIGTGRTQEEALESFIYNQTQGIEKRVSGDYML